MQLLIAVINDVDRVEEILAGFLEIGVTGATIVNSEGMGRVLSHDIPIFAGLQTLTSRSRPQNQTLFSVIEHEAGAEKVGMELPATHTVIFGNPKVGTLLMQCNGSAALDLPQKMLIRAVEGGSVIEWNDPQYLANRHDLDDCKLPLDKIGGLLKGLAAEAAGQ